MTQKDTTIFNLENIPDYLAFCKKAVAELESDQANVLRGFSAILAINHIPDWLQYKLSSSERRTLGLNQTINETVKNHYEAIFPDLVLVRSIANGFKHLRSVHSTEVVAGYGQGPFGIGPYGCPYLLIDKGDQLPPEERWAVGCDLCRQTLAFWLTTLQPIL